MIDSGWSKLTRATRNQTSWSGQPSNEYNNYDINYVILLIFFF
jgi:hypothetical protein